MAENFSNEVLSTTLQNVYTALSGLTSVAARQKSKLAQQVQDRQSGDQNLTTRIENLQTNVSTANGKLSADIDYISGALDTEVSDRETAVSEALTSAKTYVDESLENYYTASQVDGIKTSIETDYKAYADQAEVDAVNTAAADATSKTNKALEDAKAYADSASGYALVEAKAYADQAEADAVSTAATDATSKANKALEDAKTYTDQVSGNLAAVDTELNTKLGKITLSKVETPASGMAAEYKLIGPDGVAVGETISIAKDQFLKSATVVEGVNGTASDILRFVFETTTGEKTVDVALSGLFNEYSASNGIKLEGTEFTGVVDSTSEAYLTIGENGFKVSGVDSAISAAVKAEADLREAADEALSGEIDSIKGILGADGGEGDGESLVDRVSALEEVIPTSAIPAGETLLVTTGDKTVLNERFNPGIALQFNGKEVGSGITSLNFAGTTTITIGENGIAKVQIGENMNTSVWAAKDGKQGDGTPSGFPAGSNVIVPDATSATFKVGTWIAGTSVKGITTASITVKSTGKIHLDEGDNTWLVTVYGATGNILVQANVNDTVTYNNSSAPTSATVTASAVSYITGTSGITHSVTGGGLEPNYPAAVGGCAQVSFTFDLSKIDEIKNGGRFSIEIAGCGGTYKSEERFYIKESTPAIASVALAFNNDQSTKTISGVKYVKAGTFKVTTGNITNLNNQAAITNRLAATATSDFTDEDTAITNTDLTDYTLAWNNVCTYSADLTLAGSLNKKGTGVSITLTPKNAKGTGSAVTATAGTDMNINTYAETESSNSEETFLAENKRLTSTLTAWTSASTLGDGDLQVIPGEGLVYPQNNYSTLAIPEGNPNYSTSSGVRYFYRKMISGTGTKFGGTLTLAGLGGNFTDSDFDARLSIDGGSTWFNLKADRGGADATGILNSYTSSSGAISFSFPGTTSMTATDGVIIKLGWSAKDTKITKITLAM